MRSMERFWGAAAFLVGFLGMGGCGSGDTTMHGPLLTSITMTCASPSLVVGSSQQCTALGTYVDGTTRDMTSQVTWTSSDANTVKISQTGLTTAVAAGTTFITAAYASVNTTVALTILHAIPAEAQWAQVDKTAEGAYSDYYGVTVAPDGSVYAAGALWLDNATAHDFGNGVTTAGTFTGHSIILTKYDDTGGAQWARTTVGGTGGSVLFSAATASDGSVYAAGFMTGTDTLDFGNGVTTAGTVNSSDSLLVKYDSAGTPQWAKTVAAGTSYSQFNSVSTASDGSVYAAGLITGNGTYDFGNGVTATGLAAFPGSNIILVKYDHSGVPQWARTMVAGAGESVFKGVTAASDGSVYAAGSMTGTGTYDFGNGVTSAGFYGRNSMIVKYDSSGTAQWARTVDGIPGLEDSSSRTEFSSVSSASDGSVYAAGSISSIGQFNFGNNVMVDGTSTAGNDAIVLVKYAPSGAAQWARSVAAGSYSSKFLSVAVASDGSVYAAGYLSGIGTYDFGSGVMAVGTWYDTTILVKYSDSGIAQWAKTMVPGTYQSWCYGVSAASDGSVFTAGWIYGSGTLDFGDNVTATGNSVENFFLAKYH